VKKFCVDCKNEIHPRSKGERCYSCGQKNRFKTQKHPLLGTAQPKPKCIDCNVQLKELHSTRCYPCAGKYKWENGTFDTMAEKVSKTLSGHSTEYNKGNKHYRWKGGITTLHIMIRNLIESREWKKQVFARDGYRCQECFKTGNLEAHHIKEFSEILKDFLQEYNQFSPIEDKEILVRLAIKYQPFWDVNNGMTHCDNCHTLHHSKKEKE